MIKEIGKMIGVIQADSSLSEEEKKNMYSVLINATKPLESDRWIYRLVVSFLGITVVLTIAGGIFLTYKGGTSPNYQLPQGIVAIGSAAVGALAGLLAPSPSKKMDNQALNSDG